MFDALERDLYRATPAVTRDLGFSGLIRRTAPFSRLLRHTRGCGGSILTRILTGLHSVTSHKGTCIWKTYFNHIFTCHSQWMVEFCKHGIISKVLSNNLICVLYCSPLIKF
jgi:hypothetical protein